MYEVDVEPSFDFTGRCGEDFSLEKANSFLLVSSGSFSLEANTSLVEPESINFFIPKDVESCTIPYRLQVFKGESMPYDGVTIFITIR